MQETPCGRRDVHNEELRNLYPSPEIVSVMTSRRMRWARHLARMRKLIKEFKFWTENLRERDNPLGKPKQTRKHNAVKENRRLKNY